MREADVDIVVRGRHMEISDKFRELAIDKLGRLDRFGLDIARVDVEVSKDGNPRNADRAVEVELTCTGRGQLLRAEAHAEDKFAALNDACDTITERFRRAADKRRSVRRRRTRLIAADEAMPLQVHVGADEPPASEEADLAPDVVFADGPVTVREKVHVTSPMSVAEALDSLEMIGHDFYFFLDSETDQPSVVYRRRGFDYGLVRLELAGAQAAG
ncbi:MAG: ribosome-associated translation inhibitor RaiA [Candidatus Nanopelagicales bacterium]|nr:ribosome-associated translation inhibitor RaiA [Candidatus Nanopelagicales bacterium]